MFDISQIDHTWSLFLDRDGVINHDKPNDYVYNREEFIFYKGALEALKYLNTCFGPIVIVTNQKGVGRGLITEAELNDIHAYMLTEIKKAGGRIDKIYYCTAIDNNDPNRKPNPGMALQAKYDFPAIDFSRSVIVGNNISDMEFGRNAGMHRIFINSTQPDIKQPDPLIQAVYNSLADFAKALQER